MLSHCVAQNRGRSAQVKLKSLIKVATVIGICPFMNLMKAIQNKAFLNVISRFKHSRHLSHRDIGIELSYRLLCPGKG